MTLIKKPVNRPAAPPPADSSAPSHTPVWALILGAVSMLVIGIVIGVLLPIAPPQQQRPAQEVRWRLSNACLAFYAAEYARLDKTTLYLACDDMAQAYSAAHPAIVDTCLSKIWDIDAAQCIDASGQPFDTAPLDAP